MPEPTTLRAQQHALARHLRAPDAAPAPEGIEPRRLAVYRDLLHNNILGLLGGNFPVIRSTLGEDAWCALVAEFFAVHRSRTPLFTEIGREFVRFLEDRAAAGRGGDAQWLPELAHYEWVELALQISYAPVPEPLDRDGDPFEGIPVISPQAWPLAYRWPVHRIGPGCVPVEPPDAPTLVLVRRDESGEVRFAQLSPPAFRLLELMASGQARTGRDCLLALAEEAGAADREAFLGEGAALLRRMRTEGTLAGVRAG